VTLNPGVDRTLTVPEIYFDEVMRAKSVHLDWGGKGFNVSRALQALGMDSVAMGFVGGVTGQMLEQGLSDMGIATDFVHIVGETRTNIVITDVAAKRYIKVNEAGPTIHTEEMASFLDRVRQRVRPGDIWVLSGSLPPGLSPDVYAQLITLIWAGRARPFLDTSGEPLHLGCAARPYLVKPNVLEAGELMGQELHSAADKLNAAQFLLRQGIELVALSLGAGGLLLATLQQSLWARPPRIRLRNPVGAGDALLAGIVFALTYHGQDWCEQRLPLEQVARWGVAAGAAAAASEGVGVGTQSEVQGLYEQVKIEGETHGDIPGL
jgi:1-phosphofructokinase family hexose kinase